MKSSVSEEELQAFRESQVDRSEVHRSQYCPLTMIVKPVCYEIKAFQYLWKRLWHC